MKHTNLLFLLGSSCLPQLPLVVAEEGRPVSAAHPLLQDQPQQERERDAESWSILEDGDDNNLSREELERGLQTRQLARKRKKGNKRDKRDKSKDSRDRGDGGRGKKKDRVNEETSKPDDKHDDEISKPNKRSKSSKDKEPKSRPDDKHDDETSKPNKRSKSSKDKEPKSSKSKTTKSSKQSKSSKAKATKSSKRSKTRIKDDTHPPTQQATPKPSKTPKPTKSPTPGKTPRPTRTQGGPSKTPRPTRSPTPKPTPGPTSSEPMPELTPGPTPEPTAEPTPGPTPSPIPGQTPDPTSNPTPLPTIEAIITSPPTSKPETSSPTSKPETSSPTRPPTYTPPIGSRDDSRVIAYLGNWQSCPTPEQVEEYTHIVVAFAVSYTFQEPKNNCDTQCNVEPTVPICNNPGEQNKNEQELLDSWRAKGKRVILSFGGAGMGGSYAGDVNNCWDNCFGREEELSTALVDIVQNQNFDGIDLDYEYCYDTASGRHSGGCAQVTDAYSDDAAQNFLSTTTSLLRQKLDAVGNGYELTHAPMDSDMVPDSPYFQILKARNSDLSYLMPQFYNGITRPVIDGFAGLGVGAVAASSVYGDIVNGIFQGRADKVAFGFCVTQCDDSNASINQAVTVLNMIKAYDSGQYACNGGAFFWVAEDDGVGNWGAPFAAEVGGTAGCLASPASGLI